MQLNMTREEFREFEKLVNEHIKQGQIERSPRGGWTILRDKVNSFFSCIIVYSRAGDTKDFKHTAPRILSIYQDWAMSQGYLSDDSDVWNVVEFPTRQQAREALKAKKQWLKDFLVYLDALLTIKETFPRFFEANGDKLAPGEVLNLAQVCGDESVEVLDNAAKGIFNLFVWDSTVQEYHYWLEIYQRIGN